MTIVGEAFVNVIPESEGFLDDLGSKLGGLVQGVGGPLAVVGASVLAITGGLAALGEKYEQTFHTMAIATGATGQALTGLDNSFKSVLGDTAGSFDQVSGAIDKIYQKTGLTGAALDDLATKEVNLGVITKTDVGANVDATTTLFNKFNIATGEQSKQLDVLFKASQASGVSVADLASQLTTAGAPLQALGYSLDQSAALFAEFDKAGINSSAVTTSLNKAFVTLTKEGLDPAQAKAKLDALFKSLGSGKTTTADTAAALTLFGSKAGIQLTQAAQQGKLNVQGLFDTITNGKGGIDVTTQSTLSLTQRFDELKNKLSNDLEPVASKVLEDITKGIDDLLDDLQKPGFKAFEKQVQAIGDQITNNVIKAIESKSFKDFEKEVGTIADRIGKDLYPIIASKDWEKFASDVGDIGKAFAIKDLTQGLIDFGNGLTIIDQHKDVIAAIAIAIGATLIPTLYALVTAQLALAAAEIGEGIAAAAAWIATLGPIVLVGAAIAGLALLFIDNFSSIENGFKILGKAATTGFDDVETGFNEIVAFLTGIPGDIEAIFDLEVKTFENIGENIIGGIVSGLENAGSDVGKSLEKIAKDALTSFTSILKINSPSLVFADAAGSIPEGIAKGVDDNAYIVHNSLSKLYSGLTQTAATKFGNFQPSGTSNGGSNTSLSISIAAPGADATTVAQLRSVAQNEIATAMRQVLTATKAGTGSNN